MNAESSVYGPGFATWRVLLSVGALGCAALALGLVLRSGPTTQAVTSNGPTSAKSVAGTAPSRRRVPASAHRASGAESPNLPAGRPPTRGTGPKDRDESDSAEAQVRDVVRKQLEALGHLDGAVVDVLCTPPRCLATVQGPQLSTDVPTALAEEMNEVLDGEVEVAATMHTSVVGDDVLHASFMSFFLAGTPRDDANHDVSEAVRAFKEDLEQQQD